MRKHPVAMIVISAMFLTANLAGSAWAGVEAEQTKLPDRPASLTLQQFAAMETISQQPEHVAISDISATFGEDFTDPVPGTAANILQGVAYTGFPTILTILLIAAAPL